MYEFSPIFSRYVARMPGIYSFLSGRGLFYRPGLSIIILIAFFANGLGIVPLATADEFYLPAPGVMVHLSPPIEPPILKGIKVHPDNPFHLILF